MGRTYKQHKTKNPHEGKKAKQIKIKSTTRRISDDENQHLYYSQIVNHK